MDTTLKIGGVAVGAFLTLLAAGFAHDSLFQQHMTIAFICLLVGTFILLWRVDFCPATARRGRDKSGYMDGVGALRRDRHGFWGVVGFLVGVVVALQLAFPGSQHRAVAQFRPHASAAYLGRDLRLWRQCADRHLLLRRPAHLRVRACSAATSPGSCSGATSSSSSWPPPAICWASPRAVNMPSRNGMSISG